MDKCLGEGGKLADMREHTRGSTLAMSGHELDSWINALRTRPVDTTTKIVNSNAGTIRFASCERELLVLFTMVAKSYPAPRSGSPTGIL